MTIHLRQDLTLHRGPDNQDGSPTWTLHDPVRNLHFFIDWPAFEVISRVDNSDIESIVDSILHTTALHITADEVRRVVTFLEKNELLRFNQEEKIDWLIEKDELRKKTFLQNILHSYLFFRIPLVRPDAFLKKILPYFTFFFSNFFLKLTAIALAIGLWGIYRQWDQFSRTLVDTFSFEGLAHYVVTLIAIKAIHELGHAIIAKRLGCHVPTMGIAFLVMMPMAYTDVTDGWKLRSHQERLMIAGAGIATEIIIASWATFLWFLLPASSALREIAFFLATTSLAATLLVNASPFMKFDGYHILCDLLEMPNLHERCFAIARWWMREALFRLGDDYPEALPVNKKLLMIGFALCCWIYRAVIFFGIALLVYHFFFKALGILLFFIEIWYFLLRPCVTEVRVWVKNKNSITSNIRNKPFFYLIFFIIVAIFVPYDFTVNGTGLLKPLQSMNIITPIAAQIEKIPNGEKSFIPPNQVLLSLSSPQLRHQISLSTLQVSTLEKQVGAAGFSSDTLPQQPKLRELYSSAVEELNGLLAQQERLKPIASFGGRFIELAPDIEVGDWLPKDFKIATFANTDQWIVDAYIDEADLSRIKIGSKGKFIPNSPDIQSIALEVISIDYDSSRALTDQSLASTAGGSILVRQRNNSLVPEKSIYRVRLMADSIVAAEMSRTLRGSVVIYGWPRSIFGESIRGAIGTLVREAGF